MTFEKIIKMSMSLKVAPSLACKAHVSKFGEETLAQSFKFCTRQYFGGAGTQLASTTTSIVELISCSPKS